jgi:acetyl esterase/lipase
MLASHEGADYALFLNQHGITGFVLQSRLGSAGYRHPVMLGDAARAVRTVRVRAPEWGVDAQRIGIMGSSAGGHLAATLLTQSDSGDPAALDPVDRVSSRPDLGVLCYPVISMGDRNTHGGSRANLLGDKPSAELIEGLSAEKNVTAQTPPCFIWHTLEDAAVKVENSLEFAAALRAHNILFDLHIYEKGRHGFGLADKPPFAHVHPWAADLVFWLKEHQFVKQG